MTPLTCALILGTAYPLYIFGMWAWFKVRKKQIRTGSLLLAQILPERFRHG